MKLKHWELVLSLAFFLASVVVFISPAGGQETMTCEQKLNALRHTLGELKQIYNEQSSALLNSKDGLRILRNELTALQVSSKLLNDELKVSRQESAGLQAELTKLRVDLEALEILLTEAEKRLNTVNESFQDYRQTAEERITQAENERNLAIILAILAALLGAGGTAAGFIF